MTARSISLFLLCCIAIIVAPAMPIAAAEELAPPEVPNSQYQFSAVISANAVSVRSGPGENYYPTMRLDKGSGVTVVGIKFDWLKIVPPPGSFSVVAKQFIVCPEGSKTGRVTADVLNVRAGSSLSSVKYAPQCKLKKGDEVSIVGEQDEYYQIKPPSGAFLYVHQKYVDPVRQLAKTEMLPATQPAPGGAIADAGGTPATQPSERAPRPEADRPVVAAPTTRQSDESAEIEFDRLEALAKSSTSLSLDQQPLTELIKGYDALLKGESLPVSMRRMSEVRLLSLRMKLEAQQELLATRKQQEEADKKLEALRAERATIEARLAGGIAVYTALGTLQASAVQPGGQTLYRLTDPGTQRTLCYVRSGDPKHVAMIGQFVGVRGDLLSDPRLSLKTVVATELVAVDQAKVNNGVTAQVSPPSLIRVRSGETASSGN
jgi:uncharacterized protein YgiM (DUF1202 family)